MLASCSASATTDDLAISLAYAKFAQPTDLSDLLRRLPAYARQSLLHDLEFYRDENLRHFLGEAKLERGWQIEMIHHSLHPAIVLRDFQFGSYKEATCAVQLMELLPPAPTAALASAQITAYLRPDCQLALPDVEALMGNNWMPGYLSKLFQAAAYVEKRVAMVYDLGPGTTATFYVAANGRLERIYIVSQAPGKR